MPGTGALNIVIPAKAGIQCVDGTFPKACGVDSSRHGGTGMTVALSARVAPMTPVPSHRRPSQAGEGEIRKQKLETGH